MRSQRKRYAHRRRKSEGREFLPGASGRKRSTQAQRSMQPVELVNQLRGECLNRGLERDAVDDTGGAVGVGQRPAGISGITVFIAPEHMWRDGNFKTAAEKPSMSFIRRRGER